ncbi:ABC transporter permease subunit [Brenneria goodwinii]|uniref:Glutathione transport system permease protein GsiC n=1 Tax=Brenneria goodwinii TaxID=1109412 RepID=A0A0G4JTS2_9GAMM|nr:ABC transporter permease subunit [Brenneria goodwinii]MCG8158509.1 ABC transporter permease subunit [Brenneria goodwinii]MCG8163085.1 ABC transporter permease subunit [Brenneria goodwinii]MCG8167629.1 ABC transporter permease subunit [Brenneria goodwinii]MCG8172220.1 ABC transporter permease subunit [Brenneria goodwinii]MCG8176484.1 ABC transporter permease subunit [Brenneria goodwinii]
MFAYIVRRLLEMIPVLLVVSLLVFGFIKLLPGDPARIYAGADASIEAVESARQQLGLNDPLPQQYVNWLGGLFKGDLGVTYRTQQPVTEVIGNSFMPTMWLALAGFAWSVVLGLLVGVISALRRGKWQDWTLMSFAIGGISMPPFWLGLLLIQFVAMPFGVFSVSGFNQPSDIILPALTLGASVAAVMARFTRSAFLEVSQEDYVRTARSKGLRNRLIVWKHVMRNALIPVITMLGLQFGFLLGGSIVVESVFSWPGLGWLLIESIKTQDQPVIQALVMLFVFEFIVINLLVDLLYAVVNPAIRLR